jgi:hypothetical protein
VGDLKTPDQLWESVRSKNLHFLSYSEQEIYYPEISKKLGPNTYARKNLGYLYAVQAGAETIFDTDDDTFLRDESFSLLQKRRPFHSYRVTGNDWINPYAFFQPKSGLWPRGYPLSIVSRDRYSISDKLQISREITSQNVDVIQTLVNLEPDVDAIYRMVISDSTYDFPITSELLHLSWPVVAPGNTQSTFWINQQVFPYLYIPKTVSFRFTDILKMFIAQSKLQLAYAGFLSEQFRNPHDYLKDFNSEVSSYLHTENVVEFLKENRNMSLSEVYSNLAKLGICNEDESLIADLFVQEMRRIIHE